MTDFLLELRSEEIPARMQVKAKEDFARLFTDALAKAGLAASAIETFATPRRLALIARDLPDATLALREELKGPKASAPPQALDGFLRKTGLSRDDLVERDGILFAVVEKPGQPTAALLADIVPALVRTFPWPKSMRWGDASHTTESLRWVRPLSGIVALFGADIVACEVDGIATTATTVGHRFHCPGPITIGGAHDYVEKLRACHVIVHLSERAALIRDGARAAAAAAGLTLVEDEALVIENAGLTEWPVPLFGRFDAAFLSVPPEVITLTMRTNQKYFACLDKLGALANAFVCTANIAASDGGAAVIAGNERVLSARLADAKFFWENDLKVPLETQAAKLQDIVFHEKLGTVADKVERVAKLARWLVEEGIVHPSPPSGGEGNASAASEGEGEVASDETASPTADFPLSLALRAGPSPLEGGEGSLATLAERAAHLCKADLVTGMVGEFPELQGIIGGHLARAQGEDPQVADAIRDHYKPVGQRDEVPTAPVTVAVALADKLDTLFSFFSSRMRPTGSSDPFSLRRQCIGVLSLVLGNSLRFELSAPFLEIVDLLRPAEWDAELDAAREVLLKLGGVAPNVASEVMDDILDEVDAQSEPTQARIIQEDLDSLDLLTAFFADRLKVQQREAGVRHDLIDAVFALSYEDDFVRLLARVHALQGFVATEDGARLLGGYKRAANILKKEGDPPSPSRREGQLVEGKQGEGLLDDTTVPHPGPAVLSLSPSGRGTPALSYAPHPCEAALADALDGAEPAAAAAIEREDFEGAMTALAVLREPIDAFFENVTVVDTDLNKRAARLALLMRVRDAVHRVADFSKIEG